MAVDVALLTKVDSLAELVMQVKSCWRGWQTLDWRWRRMAVVRVLTSLGVLQD